MKSLIAALVLISGAAHAQTAIYTKPANAPEVFVANHGVTVAVWATQTAIGHGIGIFEKSGTGNWQLCGQCLVGSEYPTLDGVVKSAGGPGPWVAGKLADINAVLSIRYPAVTAGPTGSTIEQVNGALAGYSLRLVNGAPQIGPR